MKLLSRELTNREENDMTDYKAGDTVVYNSFGGSRTVVVTDKYEDVKNGRPGFDGYVVGDPSYTVWGYDSQIVNVVRQGV